MKTLLIAPVMVAFGLALSVVVTLSALGLIGWYRCPEDD